MEQREQISAKNISHKYDEIINEAVYHFVKASTAMSQPAWVGHSVEANRRLALLKRLSERSGDDSGLKVFQERYNGAFDIKEEPHE